MFCLSSYAMSSMEIKLELFFFQIDKLTAYTEHFSDISHIQVTLTSYYIAHSTEYESIYHTNQIW